MFHAEVLAIESLRRPLHAAASHCVCVQSCSALCYRDSPSGERWPDVNLGTLQHGSFTGALYAVLNGQHPGG